MVSILLPGQVLGLQESLKPTPSLEGRRMKGLWWALKMSSIGHLSCGRLHRRCIDRGDLGTAETVRCQVNPVSSTVSARCTTVKSLATQARRVYVQLTVTAITDGESKKTILEGAFRDT